MTEPGPLLAEGRDAQIFAIGSDRVLRRARDGRSLAAEGAVMDWARRHGFPVPAVHDVTDGALLLDRLDGPTMLDDLARHPWRTRQHAITLARLHHQLHKIPALDALPHAPVRGDRLLHLDLHPINIILTSHGPVVIDWSNAAAGAPAADVALTWVVMATATIPGRGLARAVPALCRRLFVHTFVSAAGSTDARAVLPVMAQVWAADPNVTTEERAAIDRFLATQR